MSRVARTGRAEVHPASIQFICRKAVYPNARAREVLGWEPRVTPRGGHAPHRGLVRREGLI